MLLILRIFIFMQTSTNIYQNLPIWNRYTFCLCHQIRVTEFPPVRAVPENRIMVRNIASDLGSGGNPLLPLSAPPTSDHGMDDIIIPSPYSIEEPDADVIAVLTPGGEPVGSSFPELSSEGK